MVCVVKLVNINNPVLPHLPEEICGCRELAEPLVKGCAEKRMEQRRGSSKSRRMKRDVIIVSEKYCVSFLGLP